MPITSALQMTYEIEVKELVLKNDIKLKFDFSEESYFQVVEKRILPFILMKHKDNPKKV